jgi:hypothetical protein
VTRQGRPLWLLGSVTTAWVACRVVMLWPVAPLLLLPPAHAAHAALPRRTAIPATGREFVAAIAAPKDETPPPSPMLARATSPVRLAGRGWVTPTFGLAPNQSTSLPTTHALDAAPLAPDPVLAAAPRAPSRFAASAWALIRGSGAGGGLNGPELGGSQAGLRVTYALGRARRVSLAARIATPLGEPGREAALGVEWQPTRAPVRLVVDQRIALDRGRGGPELGVIAGYGPHPLALGFDLAAYGQAGVIKRATAEGYVDGQARLTHTVASVGQARLELGAGAWGGAQPGTRRLDVGPSAAVAFPVAGHGARLSVDWRERVAGNARPGSGPALTLGADF